MESMSCKDDFTVFHGGTQIPAFQPFAITDLLARTEGTLPMRTLALRYEADAVFTEEVIDRRVLKSVRTENKALGTVDYVVSNAKSLPFQTCSLERGRVVYQIGTGASVHALKAAQHVECDAAAVDINMGCPKKFSMQGGMGAALLKLPEVAADIIGTLRRNLSVPVSAKIRLLDDDKSTVELARRLEKAGVCALTVHCRRLEDEPHTKAQWERLTPVVDALNIPVVANGDVYSRADISAVKDLTGCSSVMLARPALLNCSVFKKGGNILPLKEVILQYIRECIRYDSLQQSAKYTVMEMMNKRRHPDHLKSKLKIDLPVGSPNMAEVCQAKTLKDLATTWGIGQEYYQELERRRSQMELHAIKGDLTSAPRETYHKYDDAYFLVGSPRGRESPNSMCTKRSSSEVDGFRDTGGLGGGGLEGGEQRPAGGGHAKGNPLQGMEEKIWGHDGGDAGGGGGGCRGRAGGGDEGVTAPTGEIGTSSRGGGGGGDEQGLSVIPAAKRGKGEAPGLALALDG